MNEFLLKFGVMIFSVINFLRPYTRGPLYSGWIRNHDPKCAEYEENGLICDFVLTLHKHVDNT